MMDKTKVLSLFLDEIERRETNLLVWGVVDGSSGETEILDLADNIITQNYDAIEKVNPVLTDPGEVLRILKDGGLLFEIFCEGPETRYRSRMAETVRLLFHLRQLFPKHERQQTGWMQAKTLVADYRFRRVSRTYPKRTLKTSDFLKNLEVDKEKIFDALEQSFRNRQEGEKFHLAQFQFDATKAILESLKTRLNRGILVSAGTGSGKTLAFYLPALARISYLIQAESNEERWVKALAIYPRTELLKDQFREVYSEARLLDNFLEENNKRKIQIAALFGPTPEYMSSIKHEEYGWRKGPNGYICPFINCMECRSPMVWTESNLNSKREILDCESDTCNFVISEEEVILTRQRISESPPDILFTTTEMMNQRLGDPGLRRAFGAIPNAKKPPEMMLLDEVHTYQGFPGAQVAFLLRRWKSAIRSPVTFIGLSATLRDGERFFADLCGLDDGNVDEIKPLPSQMEKEGAEYTIALRGDPVSRTAILSTTIQTAMLLSRSLDETSSKISDGIFGTKLFAFTDKLDVINRLEPNLHDAEGQDRTGNPNFAQYPNGGLAHLRKQQNDQERYEYGQDWRMCETIGHNLDDGKIISMTSSQNPGVDVTSDIIVATATLEVGFNETNVGAVIQHKAPRGMAQFVQRKGRAGRTRIMRPWTAVILSDYGRDRILYMGYEQLFEPELPANSLPIRNRYIARMQAVYSLIEYLSWQLKDLKSRRNVWQWLSEPAERTDTPEKNFAEELVKFLTRILEDSTVLDDFSAYLCKSLQLSQDDLQPILWDHPRPLITAVIPTALRRLSTNWRSKDDEKSDYYLKHSPLPEFATKDLFSDLNLPEVKLKMPLQQPGDDRTMSVSQAMGEFAPGRISKRYSADFNLKHWVCPEDPEDLLKDKCELDISASYNVSKLGNWPLLQKSDIVFTSVFRVLEIQLEQAKTKFLDTSNARLDWHTQIFVSEMGTPLSQPPRPPLNILIEDLQIFTHQDQNPVEIRRFANASTADIRVREQNKTNNYRTRIEFVKDDLPAAIGMAMTVDGVRIKLNSAFKFIDDLNLSETTIRGLRSSRYLSEALAGSNFRTVPNPFAREWLTNIYMTTVISEAISSGVHNLEDAANAVDSGAATLSPVQVLDNIFQSSFNADQDENDLISLPPDTLHEELRLFLTNPATLSELRNLAEFLWSDVDQSWETWLRERIKVTLAGAFYYTIQHLCPQIDIENLIVDICPGPRGEGDKFVNVDINHEIWITEKSPGGNGLIEAFAQTFNSETNLFFNLLHSALQANEMEISGEQLERYLKEIDAPPDGSSLYEKVDTYRSSQSLDEQDDAFAEIRRSLSQTGYAVFHSFLSSFAARIMRSGSTTDTDLFFNEGINKWKQEEERLGIEIDARIFAYFWSQQDDAKHLASSLVLQNQGSTDSNWLFNVIYGMFWPRGRLVRQSSLGLYNEFLELPEPERLLFANQKKTTVKTVRVPDENWVANITDILQEHGTVTIEAASSDQEDLSKTINELIVRPIEVSYLKLFVNIVGLERFEGFTRAKFELPEIFQ